MSFVVCALVAAAVAQGPPLALELSRLSRLGPVPAGVPVFVAARDGVLSQGAGDPLRLADLRAAVGGKRDVVLEVDRATTAAVTGLVVAALAGAGVERVHFAAQLPDGRRGCLQLALPADAKVSATMVLTAATGGRGVPPESAIAPLQRIRRGFEGIDPQWVTTTFGVDLDGAATMESALRVLAAVADAGVDAVVVRWRLNAAQQVQWQRAPGDLAALANAVPAIPGALGLQLGSPPDWSLPARAVPQPRPEVVAAPVGFVARPAAAPVPPFDRRGAGGKYGGRGGGRGGMGAGGKDLAKAIERGTAAIAGALDVESDRLALRTTDELEAVAWAVLALLGDGGTIGDRNGPAIAQGVGILLAQQGDAGFVGPEGPGALRVHALAATAFVEASSLSNEGLVLRGAAIDALKCLLAARRGDGAWSAAPDGARPDSRTTAAAVVALDGGMFFRVPALSVEPGLAEGLLVLGGAERDDAAVAAEMFARALTQQDARTFPELERLAGVDLDDAEATFWASHVLYQVGARWWKNWTLRFAPALVGSQRDDGTWGEEGIAPHDRLRTTALRVLSLESYYRFSRFVR